MLINGLGKILKGKFPPPSKRIENNDEPKWTINTYDKSIISIKDFKIDIENAKALNLSYFQTILIDKSKNSKNNNENNLGYLKLLNENQSINLKDFISNNKMNFDFNLIKSDILGRNLTLSNQAQKNNIENLTVRFANSYTSGLGLQYSNVTKVFETKEKQNIFFQLPDTLLNLKNNAINPDYILFDFIIYAIDVNNKIIDVVKYKNCNIAPIQFLPVNNVIFNIDDVNFIDCIDMKFDNNIFNNLTRKFYVNTTNYYQDIKRQLNINSSNSNISPIDTITIQENEYEIQENLKDINISRIEDSTAQTLQLLSNTDISSSRVNYKVFIKISGTNSYIIKNYTNSINTFITSQQNNILSFLGNTKVYFLSNYNVIKIELNLKKTAFNDQNFDPVITGININNNNINLISKCFTYIPKNGDIPNLDFTSNKIKEISASSTNEIEYIYTFYILNLELKPNTIKFIFQQNFEEYILNKDIEVLHENTTYNVVLNLNENEFNDKEYSNLDVNYKINIKNFKNSNENLDRFLLLNYENIFLQQLTDQIPANSDENFQSNIFIIVKRTILQESKQNSSYFIFNQSINNIASVESNFQIDLMLNLNFKDNKKLNEYYFIPPNLIDIKEDIKYKFEAMLMAIPLDFFTTTSDFDIITRIKNLYMINNSGFIPSDSRIKKIFETIKKINNSNFSSITQFDLELMFDYYCIKQTYAFDERNIPKVINNNTITNRFKFTSNSYSFKNNIAKPGIEYKLKFLVNEKSSQDQIISQLFDKNINTFSEVYFKINNQFINCNEIVPEFLSNELFEAFLISKVSSSITININELIITTQLRFSPELARYFSLLYQRSTQDFSPYFLNFLNNNVYFKLNIPSSFEKSINNTTHKVEIRDVSEKYLQVNLYEFAEQI